MELKKYILNLAQTAKEASYELQLVSSEFKDKTYKFKVSIVDT